MAKEKQIKVTLVRSLIGRKESHIGTAKALGLTKINSSVAVDDIPAMRGMINKISYLLRIEETA